MIFSSDERDVIAAQAVGALMAAAGLTRVEVPIELMADPRGTLHWHDDQMRDVRIFVFVPAGSVIDGEEVPSRIALESA